MSYKSEIRFTLPLVSSLGNIFLSIGKWLAFIIVFTFLAQPWEASSHRSGCHRWHSCQSDRGTYICGDRGYCSLCPDNQFCLNGKSRERFPQGRSSYSQSSKKAEWKLVTRVIDGDTIIVGVRERVRLIGVDTPETKHPQRPVEYFGRQATAFTRRLVENKWVRLEFDQANSQIAHKDKYKRTLSYVYLEDGTFLNAEIIRQGYGFAYTSFPFKYLDDFRRFEREAKNHRRGLWERSN